MRGSLPDFLTRLQRLAGDAFASESADVRRKSVVWRFLDGLIDKDVRERLIRELWMKDEAHAKEYDDILKIAETARTSKQAAALTGNRHQVGGSYAAAAQFQTTATAAVAAPPPPPAARWQRGSGQLGSAPGQLARPPAARPGPGPARLNTGRAAGQCGAPGLLAGATTATFLTREAGIGAISDSPRTPRGHHVERVQQRPQFSTNSEVSRIFNEPSPSHKTRRGTS